MTSEIRLCGSCNAIVGNAEQICHECGTAVPPISRGSVKRGGWVDWIFGFGGRIDRSGLIVRLVIADLVWVGFFALTDSLSYGELLFWVSSLLVLLYVVGSLVRRAHDKNGRAWTVLLFFVPVLNIVILLDLLIMPGDKTSNQHGEPSQRFRVGY